jgi:hypothetical protein
MVRLIARVTCGLEEVPALLIAEWTSPVSVDS